MKVKLADIVVQDNRQRTAHDEPKEIELAESIKKLGLINPITVKRDPTGKFILVAGERRFRAAGRLGWPEIDVRILDLMSPEDIFEIELDENIRRVDLPWADRVRAIAQLNALRAKQAEALGLKPTLTNTAKELAHGDRATQTDIAEVRDALILQHHLNDPEVAGASSARDAMKVLRKKLEGAHRAQLAEKFDLTQTPHVPCLGSAAQVLGAYADELFDCICTDPPYGIGANSFGDQFEHGHAYSDSPEKFEADVLNLFPELYRVSKPQAHLYLFCDFRRFPILKLHAELAGYWVWPLPLIWDKNGGGALPMPDQGPRRTYECILYASKGKRRTVSIRPDVIKVPPVENLRHGAEKPVGVYIDLLMRSCLPGDTVLDPFMGSGTIFPAANALRLQAHGVEEDNTAYNLAISRLTESGAAGLEL